MLNLFLADGKVVQANAFQLHVIEQYYNNKISNISSIPRRIGASCVLTNLIAYRLFEKLIFDETNSKIIAVTPSSYHTQKHNLLETIKNSDTVLAHQDVISYAEDAIKFIPSTYFQNSIRGIEIDSLFCYDSRSYIPYVKRRIDEFAVECALRCKGFKALII